MQRRAQPVKTVGWGNRRLPIAIAILLLITAAAYFFAWKEPLEDNSLKHPVRSRRDANFMAPPLRPKRLPRADATDRLRVTEPGGETRHPGETPDPGQIPEPDQTPEAGQSPDPSQSPEADPAPEAGQSPDPSQSPEADPTPDAETPESPEPAEPSRIPDAGQTAAAGVSVRCSASRIEPTASAWIAQPAFPPSRSLSGPGSHHRPPPPPRVLILGMGEMLGSAASRAFLTAGWRVAGADDLEAGFRTSVPQDATFVELRPLGSPAGAAQLAAVVAALALGGNETEGDEQQQQPQQLPGLDAVVLGFDVRRPDAEAALALALRGAGLGPGAAGAPWTIAVDVGGRARGLYGASVGPQCHRGAAAGVAAEGDGEGEGEAARWCAAADDESDPLPLLAILSLRDADGCVPPVVGIGMSPASPTVLRAVARAGEAGAGADGESAAAALVLCAARVGAAAALGTEHKFDMPPLLHSLVAAIAPAGSPPFGDVRLPEACYPHSYSWVRPWVEDGGGGCEAEWAAAAAASAVYASALAHAVVVTAAAAVESGGPAAAAAKADPSRDSLTVALRSAAAAAAGGDRPSAALVIDTRASPLARRPQQQEQQQQGRQRVLAMAASAAAAVGEKKQQQQQQPKLLRPSAVRTSAPALAAATAAGGLASKPSRRPPAATSSRSSTAAPSAEAAWEWVASPERALPPPLLPALALRHPGLQRGSVLSLCPPIIEELERLGVVRQGTATSAATLDNATAPPAPLPGSDARPAALLDAAWWGLRHAALGGYREPHPSAADFGYDAWSALGAGDRYVLADVSLFSVTHGLSHERSAWTQYTYGSWLKRGGIPLFSTVPDPVLPVRATMYEPSDDELRVSLGDPVNLASYQAISLRTATVWLAVMAEAAPLTPAWTVRLWDDTFMDGAALLRTANTLGVDAERDAVVAGRPIPGGNGQLFIEGGPGGLWSAAAVRAWRRAMPSCRASLATRLFNNTPGAPAFDPWLADLPTHIEDVQLDYCAWREAHGWGADGSATREPRPDVAVPRLVHVPGFNTRPLVDNNATGYFDCRLLACRRPVRHWPNCWRPEISVASHYVPDGPAMLQLMHELWGRNSSELDAYCAPDALPEGCGWMVEAREHNAPPEEASAGLCG